MARGSLDLDHRASCPLCDVKPIRGRDGKVEVSAVEQRMDARKCRCTPRVFARLNGVKHPLGHLSAGWRKSDLDEYEDKLHDLRDPNRRLSAKRSPLLREWYAEWIVTIRAAVEKGLLAEGTRVAYEQRWRRYISRDRLAAIQINAITVDDLRSFVDRMIAGDKAKGQQPLSHRSANELLTPVSAMLTDAEIRGYIPSNPARVSRRARHGATQRNAVYQQLERKSPQHLTVGDARALICVTPAEYQLIVAWPLITGARRAEILGAWLEDALWARRELRIHYQLNARRERAKIKAGRKREVVLWSGLELPLGQARAAGRTWVFNKPGTDAPLRLGGADAILRESMEKVGLRVPKEGDGDERQMLWHALRHTYSTYLRSEGVRWEAVEYMMGHKPRDTTEKYVHLLDADKAAVERALTKAYGDLVIAPWGAGAATVA